MAMQCSDRSGFRYVCSVLSVLGVLLFSAPGQAQQESIGQVIALRGQATVKRAATPQPVPLAVQHMVFREDVLQTAAASRLKVALIDGTELTLGENGMMTLSALVYAPQQNTQSSVLTVAKGAFWGSTKKLVPQAMFEMRTGTAVASIRGTEWVAEVTAKNTAIAVVQGTVAVQQVNPTLRGEVVLTPGMGTDVSVNRPPTPPVRWSAQRLQTLLRAVALP